MNDSLDTEGQDSFNLYLAANRIPHCDPIAHWTKELGGHDDDLARMALEFLSAPGEHSVSLWYCLANVSNFY